VNIRFLNGLLQRRWTLKEAFMNKVTLAFPTHDSLWLFHGRSNAINVAIRLRTNTLTGLFTRDEVNNALVEFGATELTVDQVANSGLLRQPRDTERSASKQF